MVTLVHTLQQHTDELRCCCFSAGLLAACSADETLRVDDTSHLGAARLSAVQTWLRGSLLLLQRLRPEPLGLFLQDTLRSRSLHGFVPVTPEAEAPRCAKAASRCFSLRCSSVSEAGVVACCFSPCGQVFVTGCTNGDLKLWDVDISLLHAEKDAHDLGVTC
ncbi:unnamed protein product [Pleuronectes platessa]|uniref:Uncharacterized protein n=1 Tax=Pleuronectes platessa TaxID=8262 RepID=A0A9N7ZDF7_PLEPL|nr:unnamed protein product [Pleuronectes platessa]